MTPEERREHQDIAISNIKAAEDAAMRRIANNSNALEVAQVLATCAVARAFLIRQGV